MTTRRSFIADAALATGALVVGGCATPFGKSSFYGPTIRDRLWMWGHHKDSTLAMKSWKGRPSVDQAEGCKMMGIPNNCVVRWRNLPKYPWGDYFEQFRALKRFTFSITDGAAGGVRTKMKLAFEELQPKYPNLTGCFLDDYFINDKLHQSKADLVKIAHEVHEHNLRLSVVLYADQGGVKESVREELSLCDETSFWFWRSANIHTMGDLVKRCREAIGPEKDLLLGLYMWDFSCGQPVSGERMEMQLNFARKFLADRTVTGLIFHPSFAAALDEDAVRLSKEWIRSYGEDIWGT